jgi:anaerobic magnesium-protoporphyrin IX monomethyl ester cyclase
MVGATCVTLNSNIAARNLKVCKDFDRGIVTMLGGPHASFAIKETLLRSRWIDAVIIGEGERTIVELARMLEKGKDIQQVKGIAFREDNRVVKTEPRPLIEDLKNTVLSVRPAQLSPAGAVPTVASSARGPGFSGGAFVSATLCWW